MENETMLVLLAHELVQGENELLRLEEEERDTRDEDNLRTVRNWCEGRGGIFD